VPLDVRFGDETLRDGVDITADQFLQRLALAGETPATSQPPPARFEAAFRDLAADHDAIVAVLLSTKLSGALGAATLARDAVADVIPVELVDSRTAAMGLGFQALHATELARGGVEAATIADRLRGETNRYHVVFFVDTLEYLRRGGRIGRAAALIGGVLQIKPLLRVDEGQVVPMERARTRARAVAGLVDFVKTLPRIERVAALYSSDRAAGEALADRIAGETGLPRERLVVSQIGPTVATHIGPGALGVAVVEPVG
ncbi:MAG: DegV family protein, partial [Thermomicrobiales bacterium]|nr:DegV family protein [Thermomicrobiales bacterium]